MRRPIVFAAIMAVLALTVSVAQAANATWNFSTWANPASPEVYQNFYGVPSAVINVDPLWGTGWYDTMPAVYGSAQGWWDIATGSIVLSIPDMDNAPPESWKELVVKITYWDDISKAPTIQASPQFTVLGKTTVLAEAGPVGGGWYTDTWVLNVAPIPSMAVITILGDADWGSQIDRINVIPEPSGVLALFSGMAGLTGLILRRRRA